MKKDNTYQYLDSQDNSHDKPASESVTSSLSPKSSARFLVPGYFLLILGLGNLIIGHYKLAQYNEVLQELAISGYDQEPDPNLSPLQRLKSDSNLSIGSIAYQKKAEGRRDFYSLVNFGGQVFLSLSLLYFIAYGLSRFW
ncbi:MAG TPA: hypothetical protein PKA63_11590 [Oligoflexia bacterium]|nr:hypothetical protein [Oligoflexia bacterium]HMP49296.1 hypothetical protein [Oligoflexia bacterium]